MAEDVLFVKGCLKQLQVSLQAAAKQWGWGLLIAIWQARLVQVLIQLLALQPVSLAAIWQPH